MPGMGYEFQRVPHGARCSPYRIGVFCLSEVQNRLATSIRFEQAPLHSSTIFCRSHVFRIFLRRDWLGMVLKESGVYQTKNLNSVFCDFNLT